MAAAAITEGQDAVFAVTADPAPLSDLPVHLYDNDGPPSSPSGLRLGRLEGESRLAVRWDEVPEATGYEVRWGVAAESARQTAWVSGPAFTTPELAPTAAYAFQVSACDDAGCSERSPEVRGSPELSYQWRIADASHSELAGLAGFLDDAGQAQPRFTVPGRRDVPDRSALDDGNWIDFELMVTDEEGGSDTDTVTVTESGANG